LTERKEKLRDFNQEKALEKPYMLQNKVILENEDLLTLALT
jgi:hypothetical protein